MRMTLELLIDELERLRDLPRKFGCCLEPHTVQDDLRNEDSIWHNHCDLAEEGLQIVRKRSSPQVERVHGDEKCAILFKSEIGVLNCQPYRLIILGTLDNNDELRDNREDVDLKPVELIEAYPSSTCSKALEELAHRLEVNRALTVEDIAVSCDHLRELFACFCLASAGWSNWRSTISIMQCQEERLEASLRQWSNDET